MDICAGRGQIQSKGENSLAVDGNVNQSSHYGKQCGEASEKENQDRDYPAITSLYVHPQDEKLVCLRKHTGSEPSTGE